MSTGVPPIAQSDRVNYLDIKLLELSSELFENPLFGYGIVANTNILFIYAWCKKRTIFSILSFLLLFYLIVRIILKKVFGLNQKTKLNEEDLKTELLKIHLQVSTYVKNIVSLENYVYTFSELAKIYVFFKIINLFNDKFLLLLLLNAALLYSPIEKKCNHFVFKGRMAVKQVIEGVIGLVSCFIPRYEEKKEK